MESLVEKVRFYLHPTFGCEFREEKSTYGSDQYKIKYLGWGVFNIPIKIYWREATGIKEVTTVDHYLSFDGDGKWRDIKIRFQKDKLE